MIDNLKLLLAPFLPFTSQRLHEMLGYEGQLFGRPYVETFTETERAHAAPCYDNSAATGRREPGQLPSGHVLQQPSPLFKKLDDDTAEMELARLQA